jgi:hypothetical protein
MPAGIRPAQQGNAYVGRGPRYPPCGRLRQYRSFIASPSPSATVTSPSTTAVGASFNPLAAGTARSFSLNWVPGAAAGLIVGNRPDAFPAAVIELPFAGSAGRGASGSAAPGPSPGPDPLAAPAGSAELGADELTGDVRGDGDLPGGEDDARLLGAGLGDGAAEGALTGTLAAAAGGVHAPSAGALAVAASVTEETREATGIRACS